MTRKAIIPGIILLPVLAVLLRSYMAFHPSPAFLSRSPANSWWTVDCVKNGFRHPGLDFRVHDLRENLLSPILLGDLSWEGKYFPGYLFWSSDGSVAAASITFVSDHRTVFGCAYDFRAHRAIGPSDGSALDDSKHQEIQALLESRGGYQRFDLPDFIHEL